MVFIFQVSQIDPCVLWQNAIIKLFVATESKSAIRRLNYCLLPR